MNTWWWPQRTLSNRCVYKNNPYNIYINKDENARIVHRDVPNFRCPQKGCWPSQTTNAVKSHRKIRGLGKHWTVAWMLTQTSTVHSQEPIHLKNGVNQGGILVSILFSLLFLLEYFLWSRNLFTETQEAFLTKPLKCRFSCCATAYTWSVLFQRMWPCAHTDGSTQYFKDCLSWSRYGHSTLKHRFSFDLLS